MRQSRYRKSILKKSSPENKIKPCVGNSQIEKKSLDSDQISKMDTSQDSGFLSSLVSFITNWI